MFFHKNNQKGFALFYVTILVLAIIIASGINISVLTYNQQKIFQNIVKSTQAYYAAEAGLEDTLLRLENNMNLPSSYSFNVGNASVTNNISDESANSKIITAEANSFDRIRKMKVNYQVSTQDISFYYGAQIGEGGMEMGNGSLVKGNIYSNGSVFGGGTIEDTVIIAGNGNKIKGLNIGKDAQSYSCEDCEIGGDLIYVTGGTIDDCDVDGSIIEQSEEIQPKDLPISESQINEWKQEAEAGGTIIGDYIVSGKTIQNLGPKKITGKLIVDNLATLNMTGTIWTLGGVRIDNGATVQLDQSSYGSLSGLMITDGKIKIKPGTYLAGTKQAGSYLLLLSTDSETESITNPAVDVDNNSDTAIFYTTQGLIVLRNNIQTKEVTGYKVYLDNNAEILYESGLKDTSFSSGPGASWQVTSWKEIE
jgi:Tfp pilus assembly protein PilX